MNGSRARVASGVLVAAVLGGWAVAGCGNDATRRASNITASSAWATAPTPELDRSFVYVTLTSDADDELTSASVPLSVASQATVSDGDATVSVGGHLGHLDGDGAPDHADSDSGIALDTGVPMTLQPGAGRITLDGLAAPLDDGDTFPVELRFASGAIVTVTAVVADGPPAD